ncbi:MAG TPA: prohibitin family protein [Thermodesulfobacteriota bacterium]
MRDTFDPREFTRRTGRMGLPRWAVPAAIAVLLAVVFSTAVVQIPAGYVGVVSLFGKVSDRALEPGLHLVNPLARVIRMDVRTNEVKEAAVVPSKEGLSVGADISVLFRLEDAPSVYKNIGPNYVQRVVEPQIRSELRGVTARYEARALYTVDRALIEQEIAKELEPKLAARGVRLEAVLLRDVRLPEQVRQAIEAKAAAEQEAERMRFVLLKEQQEAERKKIEAQGIAEFQQVVSKGIDQRLLQWRAIEAVQELARSQNAKFVVLGDKSGLPMIINPN